MTQSDKKKVTYYLPNFVLNELNAYAEETGLKKSVIVKLAIDEFIANHPNH